MTGPWQQRLHDELDGTAPGAVEMAATQWELASQLLGVVSASLNHAAGNPALVRVGRETGRAASAAFARSAEALDRKAEELRQGGQAFLVAGRVMRQAQARRDALGTQGPAPTAPAFGPGPRDEADVRKQAAYDTAAAAWQADHERREREARQASEEMAAGFQRSSAILRRIHGETEPERDRSGPADGPGTTPAGGTTAAGASSYGAGAAVSASASGTGPAAGGGREPGVAVPAPGTGGPASQGSPAPAYGVPQGAGAGGGSAVPGPTAAATSGSAAASTGAGAALGGLAVGGLAAGAAGGLRAAAGGTAAGGTAAGVRGASTTAATAARNVRPIGTSSMRGASPTLGRPAAVTGVSRASSPGGRSAAGSAARGQGVGSTTGAAAATGRADRKQERRPAARLGYGEEWELDEDESGPRVIS